MSSPAPARRSRIILSALRTAVLYALVLLAVLLGTHWWQTRHMPLGTAPDVRFARVQDAATPPAAGMPDGTAAAGTASATDTTAAGHAAAPAHSLAQWRQQHAGQPVVLYFWADWCSICRLEQPLISRFVADHPVLPVAWLSGPASQVARHERRHQLHWNSAVDEHGELAAAFGVRGTPAFIVLDAQGRIASRTLGMTTPWGLRLRMWWAALQSG